MSSDFLSFQNLAGINSLQVVSVNSLTIISMHKFCIGFVNFVIGFELRSSF